MANGIKLRRGLKTALNATIAEGEFVFCTDTGELGFKKGTSEVYVDLEKLTTDVDDLQTAIDKLPAKEGSLLPGQFKISVNEFYDFDLNPQSKPRNRGGFRIPLAKVNQLYIGNSFALHQAFYFNNSKIKIYAFDRYGGFMLWHGDVDYMIIDTQSDGYGGFELYYNDTSGGNAASILNVLDDGNGNFNVWLELKIDPDVYTAHKVKIAFDMDCISEVGKDQNQTPYNVFLPPLGLEITPYNGES